MSLQIPAVDGPGRHEMQQADTERIEDQTAADLVKQIGPEGKPHIGAMSPKGLRSLVVWLAIAFVVMALVVGFTISWTAGVVLAGVGLLGILLNPACASALLRANDRQQANAILDKVEPHR